MLALDKGLDTYTGKGLSQFFLPADHPFRLATIQQLAASPDFLGSLPPLLVLSSDQGGGGFQTYWYMLYQCSARVMLLSDPSHRGWNDLKQALVDAGLWPFILLFAIVLNLDFGPWDGAAFHQKAAESMGNVMANGGLQHPLLRACKEAILKDQGWWERRHEEHVEVDLQELCLHCFDAKSQRVALNRWMNLIHSAKKYLPFWHCRLVAYLNVGVLEGAGLPTGEPLSAVPRKATPGAPSSSSAAGSSTDGPKTTKK
eukprot:9422080-Lingulodinium_polyedra.AAC.1